MFPNAGRVPTIPLSPLLGVYPPFSLSRALITSASRAMLISSSTKLLNVSFMVLVLRNREENGTGGVNSERQREKREREDEGEGRTREIKQHITEEVAELHQAMGMSLNEGPLKPQPSPSSSASSSGEDSEYSSFHFLLFLGGGSALVLGCLARGLDWDFCDVGVARGSEFTERGGVFRPSSVFAWEPLEEIMKVEMNE